MTFYSIGDVQRDWRCLDSDDFSVPAGVRLVSHENFIYRSGFESVEYVTPGRLISFLSFWGFLFNLFYAWRLLRHTSSNAVLIVDGCSRLWLCVGLLNRFMLRKRKILLWDVFVEVKPGWSHIVVRAAMASFRLSVLWSRKQIEPHAKWLNLPIDRFVFLPYKANHSKMPTFDLTLGNYVFAGGNGKRDYKTLTDAVRATEVPVIVSATDPDVRNQIAKLPNLIVIAAWEPAFAQLQAGARFTVVPMDYTGLKGGGEANMCNGMWHGKPVIAVDRMSAEEYIVDGETGYIVPNGDSALLHRRIVELWTDPEKCSNMGQKARIHALTYFTHDKFIQRLLRLATLCGSK